MTDLKDAITLHAIRQDIHFAGKLVGGMQAASAKTFAPIIAFCINNHLSLFIFESRRQFERIGGARLVSLSPDAQNAIRRSRHGLKLFEDTKLGIDGQIRYIEDEIIPAHQKVFLGNTWLPIARCLETDLGVYYYEGVPVSSTLAANFALGTKADETIGPRADLRSIAVEYGRYFGAHGATVSFSEKSFMARISGRSMKWRDLKSWKAYPRWFNGSKTPALNAWLGVFQMWMNFVEKLLPLDLDSESRQTIFKMQYLTYYQVIRSLLILREERQDDLTAVSLDAVSEIVDDGTAKLLTDSASKGFRNTLMHYGVDDRVDDAALRPDEILYGLTEIYYSGMTHADISGMLRSELARVAGSLNQWASSKL